ncbi:GTP-binding protein [Blastopirellula sp. J2-11]|uniref:GTP-binding protein n=1 Tax=Blastopirellula sp. J2-11 TaxID=2943192 RepID=UPI0021C5BFC0|nr:GTP-binding protein [Blastopirellula sp. J2-11]UUO08161.1 GTP-binding protein [Blastopirellula sp. J2-11]
MSTDSSPETTDPPPHVDDERYQHALDSVRSTLDRFRGCSDQEKDLLRRDLRQMQEMESKLTSGRVEIVVFGEISTGKSALINAMVGQAVTEVDVQGGWTREIWHVAWDGCGYRIPGLGSSEVVLIDTPGINEVGGAHRGEMAQDAARRSDMLLFVTDSDLNETEYSALVSLAAVNKPIILVLNKVDLYSPDQRKRLHEVLAQRLDGVIQPENIVETSADPRDVEYIVEAANGTTTSQWRKPKPNIEALQLKMLEVLEQDGLALLALNAAMYSADKSDRIASLKLKIRNDRANQHIWGYAVVKATTVAFNPAPIADVIGGGAVDVAMVWHLAHIYGIEMTWANAEKLVKSIFQAAGWVTLGELTTHAIMWSLKAVTLGWGSVLTVLPQGAAAGYGSYIVGQSAKYYFEHGASWGSEGPKSVVQKILDKTDRKSVIQNLRDEILKKLRINQHANPAN